METAQGLKSPLVLGTLTSVWIPTARVLAALKPDFGSASPDKNGDKEKAVTTVKSLRLMWNPAELIEKGLSSFPQTGKSCCNKPKI